jgi:FAD/FMN-containing dehydrogenase
MMIPPSSQTKLTRNVPSPLLRGLSSYQHSNSKDGSDNIILITSVPPSRTGTDTYVVVEVVGANHLHHQSLPRLGIAAVVVVVVILTAGWVITLPPTWSMTSSTITTVHEPTRLLPPRPTEAIYPSSNTLTVESIRPANLAPASVTATTTCTGVHHMIRQHLLRLNDQMDGTIYFPQATGYTDAAVAWVRWNQQEPILTDVVYNDCNTTIGIVIVQVQHEADVQLALPILSYLQTQYNFPFRVRSGGHHKLGYSSLSDIHSNSTMNGGAVLSLSLLHQIIVPPPQVIHTVGNVNGNIASPPVSIMIGPAATVRDFLQQVTRPTGYGGVIGFCSNVAEGGFVLGGGFGLLSRMYGLGLDNVVSFRVVLSDGRLVNASSIPTTDTSQHADLFWALRGAGSGSFGVVTAMEYRIHPVGDTIHYLQLKITDHDDKALFLFRLGDVESILPDNVIVMYDEIDAINFMWSGRNESEAQQGDVVLHDLVQSLLESPMQPINVKQGSISWTETFGANKTADTDLDWGEAVWAAGCWTGFLLPENNTVDVWNDILRHMEIGLTASQPYLFPDIELWGGAIHRTHTTATAFPYRSAIYNVGVLLMIPVNETNATAVFEQESMKVNQWWYKIDQYLTGSYVNYPTISLLDHEDKNNYAKVFWGENLPRLVKIKQRYDPDNVFRFPMSVPLQL